MFHVPVPISGSVCTPTGEVDFDLEAGQFSPSGDDEAAVAAFLVSIGAAEPVNPRPRRSTKEN